MRLSTFIRTQSEQILSAWDEFAATVHHSGKDLDAQALRDHAGQILMAIAEDLDRPQSSAQGVAKSQGNAPREATSPDTPAETHADTRITAGFAVDAMITEYRALRASVLRLWAASKGDETHADELQQLTRFNEAIDQAVAESVARYSEQVQRYTNLFMGMLGHDIRNPLGTIRLATEYLVRSGQLSAKAAEPINNATRRIKGIVELVVDFSRAQSDGVMPIHPVPGNLERIFSAVVEESRVRHPARQLRLVANGNSDGEWDEGRMGQLLSNLLENALTYGDQDQPVTVRLDGAGDTVGVTVHNRGPVIPPQERERIFEPRSRGLARDPNRAPDGLGLGLYICREITRAHNGTLSLRSDPAEGTTFLARLPRHRDGAGVADPPA
jgi:signal transduction histidine kinase